MKHQYLPVGSQHPDKELTMLTKAALCELSSHLATMAFVPFLNECERVRLPEM